MFAIGESQNRCHTSYEILYAELRSNGIGAWLHWNNVLDRVLLVDASDLVPSGRDVGRAP